MALKMAKKLSTKEFGNLTVKALRDKVAAAAETGDRFFIGRMFGSVRRQEVVETPHGVSIKFIGEVRGQGWDGTDVFSGVCYLPDPAEGLLSAALNDAQGDDATARVSVEFAFDFFAVEDKGVTGYKYVVESLIDVAPSDPVAKLAGTLPPLMLGKPEGNGQAVLEHKPEAEGEAEDTAETPAKPAKAGKK